VSLLDRRQFTIATAAACLAARFSGAGAVAADPTPNQHLLDLLGMIPTGAFGGTTLSSQTATYADLAGQLKVVGVKTPVDLNDAAAAHAWIAAVRGMAGPSALTNALLPDWKTTFGFEVLDIDQSLEFGMPPLVVTAYRGRFKPEAIGTALKASGYTSIDQPGAVVWSLSEDEKISVSNPANRLALARMNNVALLGNDVLLAAPRLDALKAMLAAVAKTAPSMAADKDLSALVNATKVGLASCLFVSGDSVSMKPGPVKTILGGISFGPAIAPDAATPVSASSRQSTSADLAKMELTLLLNNAADSKALAASIDAGLKTGTSSVTNAPYADYFSDWKIALVANAPIVTVELTFAAGHAPASWSKFIYSRDLGFLSGS
jgi:hypothetical protein